MKKAAKPHCDMKSMKTHHDGMWWNELQKQWYTEFVNCQTCREFHPQKLVVHRNTGEYSYSEEAQHSVLWISLKLFEHLYITCQSMEQTAGVPFFWTKETSPPAPTPPHEGLVWHKAQPWSSLHWSSWLSLYCTKSNKSKSCWEAPTSGTPPSARACHTLTRLAHKLQLVRTMQNWDTRNGSGWLELGSFRNETLGWIVHHRLSINPLVQNSNKYRDVVKDSNRSARPHSLILTACLHEKENT